jgi:HPt (histidine-containing phosphotransfer) domain-containing protein
MTPDEVVVDNETMDHAAALRRTEGDVELLTDMMRIFLADCPRLVAQLRAAVTSGAPVAIERAAHEIKGCVGNFAAARAFEAAEQLELAGRSRNLRDVPASNARLDVELSLLIAAMERHVNLAG